MTTILTKHDLNGTPFEPFGGFVECAWDNDCHDAFPAVSYGSTCVRFFPPADSYIPSGWFCVCNLYFEKLGPECKTPDSTHSLIKAAFTVPSVIVAYLLTAYLSRVIYLNYKNGNPLLTFAGISVLHCQTVGLLLCQYTTITLLGFFAVDPITLRHYEIRFIFLGSAYGNIMVNLYLFLSQIVKYPANPWITQFPRISWNTYYNVFNLTGVAIMVPRLLYFLQQDVAAIAVMAVYQGTATIVALRLIQKVKDLMNKIPPVHLGYSRLVKTKRFVTEIAVLIVVWYFLVAVFAFSSGRVIAFGEHPIVYFPALVQGLSCMVYSRMLFSITMFMMPAMDRQSVIREIAKPFTAEELAEKPEYE